MKAFFTHVLLAIVLFVAGAGFWIAGDMERRLTEAHRELATLRHAAVIDDAALETSVATAARTPWIGNAIAADAGKQRAIAEYWLADYEALTPQRDASGQVTEANPAVRFLAANGAYRESQHAKADRPTTVRRLEAVMKGYSDVLASDGGNVDAAYNYEYVVRQRDALSRPKTPAAVIKDLEAASAPPATLHGQAGEPPVEANMGEFKVVIPKRTDERNSAPEAGKGGQRIRKG